MSKKLNIFWFRRDLRLNDNSGLYHALTSGNPVLPIFIFDTNILNKLNSKEDARVSFIYQEIEKIKNDLEKRGSSLKIFHGTPIRVFENLCQTFEIESVYTNKDYEPYGVSRDLEVCNFLERKNISFNKYKDHVIFEEKEVVKDNGDPYTIFTPFSKRWKQRLKETGFTLFPSENYLKSLFRCNRFASPKLAELGFAKANIKLPEQNVSESIISAYDLNRDIPSRNGTTKLGIHLRFGTISIRNLAKIANNLSETFLNELIWRDFFTIILWHFPHVVTKSFRPKYDFIPWRNNENEFKLWCQGKTGYPMIDAGMRELNETGFMHNRVRMIVASFLSKHLLIDWRWGEAYFAEKLLDYELASNNGNWQWAAGCGCDAAPYFRVFNPQTQQKKFDKEEKYIRKWIKEYGTVQYAQPIIEHKFARERALSTYKLALQ